MGTTLFLGVCLHKLDLIFGTRSKTQIRESFVVDREEAHRRAVLGRHVGDGGTIGKGEAGKPGAVELDKFSDDALLAQHVRNGEDEVGGRGAFRQPAIQFETDDGRNQDRERLAEHCGFRFNAADAPSENAEAVHHRGVRVGADQRIGERDPGIPLLFAEHNAREIFQIYLVADAGVRRNNFEILKPFLAPAEKRVAFDIALHFEISVERERVRGAELIHLHGVVDDELSGKQGIDFLRVAAQMAHGVAHRGEINDGRNAGEILQEHARGHEGNFFFGGSPGAGRVPSGECANIVGENKTAVLVTEQIFEQYFQREGKARDVADTGARKGLQAENLDVLFPDGKPGFGAERIGR